MPMDNTEVAVQREGREGVCPIGRGSTGGRGITHTGAPPAGQRPEQQRNLSAKTIEVLLTDLTSFTSSKTRLD